MAPVELIEIVALEDASGTSPFRRWLSQLDFVTRNRILSFLDRVRSGNLTAAKSVGSGVSEFRLDFGPGYRIYFAREGDRLILLLGAGSKQRQDRDIQAAKTFWELRKLEMKKKDKA